MGQGMDMSANTAQTRRATRLSFVVAGLISACWAPLVPLAKARSGIGEGELGLLLLCLGIGSLIAMPLTGWVSARAGARPMILAGGAGLVLVLPLLAVLSAPLALAGALLLFGAALGTLDVAMNVHAVEVERAAPRPLMSGFHAMFSLGGIIGAGGMVALLSLGLSAFGATLVASGLSALTLAAAAPDLLRAQGGEPMPLALPRGPVLLLAALTAIVFQVEGAVLDWGALLALGRGLVTPEGAGLGFMLFAAAMTAGRFMGDRVVQQFGGFRVLVAGGLCTIAGIALLLLAPPVPALAGFVLIGLGASNLVPVLFSLAGRQTVMPAGLAIAAVTTTGYAGILVAPAGIGYIAEATSLPTAFWMLAGFMALVPLSARSITRAG